MDMLGKHFHVFEESDSRFNRLFPLISLKVEIEHSTR